ncbi:hypothetical protein ACH4ZU_08290 [Streptomyces sp. NPDC020472]|uniref:hypothetical protein n=1 Tax=Streptomyces sp. NPDC020472 TaxID=3365075 RepID=UPI0037B73221
MRETYDAYAYEAAARLRGPVAAWRWAAASGVVPAADAGPGRWSRTAVEAADPEAVRAARRGRPEPPGRRTGSPRPWGRPGASARA